MKDLTPRGEVCQLEPDVIRHWEEMWLRSDVLATKLNTDSVRFPAGYSADVDALTHGNVFYNPSNITVPVLFIRGAWDAYPNHNDAQNFLATLENAPAKNYVVIENATHVMHLEKGRHQLYKETLHFLRSGETLPVRKRDR